MPMLSLVQSSLEHFANREHSRDKDFEKDEFTSPPETD
jgi:hypothetical protein